MLHKIRGLLTALRAWVSPEMDMGSVGRLWIKTPDGWRQPDWVKTPSGWVKLREPYHGA